MDNQDHITIYTTSSFDTVPFFYKLYRVDNKFEYHGEYYGSDTRLNSTIVAKYTTSEPRNNPYSDVLMVADWVYVHIYYVDPDDISKIKMHKVTIDTSINPSNRRPLHIRTDDVDVSLHTRRLDRDDSKPTEISGVVVEFITQPN